MTHSVDKEVNLLVEQIGKLGTESKEGVVVKYGKLFKETADIFEALAGTMRAAKKRGLIKYQGELLLSPTHDNLDIILLKKNTTTTTTTPTSTTTTTKPAVKLGVEMKKV
eukprot:TRINITY_DN1231_c0_g1_i1.p1 TRINITY_DN1231_c0_g1~~TRINITY_DN1231_c0_g1_i1.p1  ORF type:complete len:110 (+),score=34.68 TRINITY_DN1231_c0_g1_i1:54-383(+)